MSLAKQAAAAGNPADKGVLGAEQRLHRVATARKVVAGGTNGALSGAINGAVVGLILPRKVRKPVMATLAGVGALSGAARGYESAQKDKIQRLRQRQKSASLAKSASEKVAITGLIPAAGALLRSGVKAGVAAGAVKGALSKKVDPNTGERQGLAKRTLKGAAKGGLIGGALGAAAGKLTNPS